MCKTSKSSSVGMWSSQEEELYQKLRRSIKKEHATSLNITISRRNLKWKHYMQMEEKGALRDESPSDLLKESRDLNHKQQSKKQFLWKASKWAEASKAHLAEQGQDMKLRCQVKLLPVASLLDSPSTSLRTVLQALPVWNHYIRKVTRKSEENKELNIIQSLFFSSGCICQAVEQKKTLNRWWPGKLGCNCSLTNLASRTCQEMSGVWFLCLLCILI